MRKRLIILLLFVLLSSFAAFCQETVHAYLVQFGRWDEKQTEWNMGSPAKCDIDFIMEDNVITATDLANSVYTTSDIISESDSETSWNAVDEEGKECVVVMKSEQDFEFLIIVYSDIVYRYVITF